MYSILCSIFRNIQQDYAVQEALSIFGADFDYNEIEQTIEFATINSMIGDDDLESSFDDDNVSTSQRYYTSIYSRTSLERIPSDRRNTFAFLYSY